MGHWRLVFFYLIRYGKAKNSAVTQRHFIKQKRIKDCFHVRIFFNVTGFVITFNFGKNIVKISPWPLLLLLTGERESASTIQRRRWLQGVQIGFSVDILG